MFIRSCFVLSYNLNSKSTVQDHIFPRNRLPPLDKSQMLDNQSLFDARRQIQTELAGQEIVVKVRAEFDESSFGGLPSAESTLERETDKGGFRL